MTISNAPISRGARRLLKHAWRRHVLPGDAILRADLEKEFAHYPSELDPSISELIALELVAHCDSGAVTLTENGERFCLQSGLIS